MSAHPPFATFLVLGVAGISPLLIYLGAIIIFILSISWRPHLGLYFLIPFFPLQTTRYLLHPLPFGEKLVDFVLLGVIVGLYLHRKGKVFPQTPLNSFLAIWAVFYYVSLWRGAFFLGSDLPLWFTDQRLSNYKNYMVMPLIFLVVAAVIENKQQMRILLILMAISVLRVNAGFFNTVSDRDLSHFSYGLRYAGALGYAGENGLAAFEAQLALFCIAFYSFVKGIAAKSGLVFFIASCVYCLLFAFSRGGYMGFIVGMLFLGILRERKLLIILLILLLAWQIVVPTAVTERIFMTYNDGQIESSANERVTIWDDAIRLVPENFLIGTGFDTYEFMGRVEEYKDTHNIYLKVLVETGILGLALFLVLLWKFFHMSFRLYRTADDPFFRALGLGTAAYVVCAVIVNFFGDRWTYLQVNGYLWVFLGLVVSAQALSAPKTVTDTPLGAENQNKIPVLARDWR
jgi:putative inorganic carbon (HCO3(-)) transporter